MTHETKPKVARNWPRLPNSVVQAALAGHSTLGLVAAALLYVVCLTGVPSVFAKELMQWETPRAAHVAHAGPETQARVLSETLRLAQAEGPVDLVMVFAPERDMPRLRGRAYGDGVERIWSFDAAGENPVRVTTPATSFLTELHENLHAPGWGAWLVGFSGVVLATLLISGLVSYPRIFRDAFRLRRGGSWRLQEADLHNRLSVWAAPFHLAIAITGAFLGLATLLGLVVGLAMTGGDFDRAVSALSGESSVTQAPSMMSDIGVMARTVEDMSARTEVGFILVSRPGQAGQQVFIDVVSQAQLAGGQTYVIDAAGEPQRGNGYFDGSFAQQMRGAMVPLHYGSFGGWPVKLAYGLLGAGLCIVVSTGVSIWIARRDERGRPTPGWARIWTALAWGQVAALAASATVALAGLDPLPWWLGLGAAALLTAFSTANRRAFARAWRTMAGVSLLAPIAAIAIRQDWSTAPMPLTVSLVLASLSALLVLGALRGWSLPAPAIARAEHALDRSATAP